ncbi:diaphanous -like protein [Brachionus plicatilis]|uniref:Diaphanous-like protein n=1 Tax=Brachionus plicatilis TaxID=10195 RepID=A0A3M7RDX6_BRAPC|nr:diaphanous -like protein [Brachionus plicatilis]
MANNFYLKSLQDNKKKRSLRGVIFSLILRNNQQKVVFFAIKNRNFPKQKKNLDPKTCFEYLFNSVKDSPSECCLLSILQQLLLIRDDIHIRYSYFRLIEECVARIALHKDGRDPDFNYGPKLDFDIDSMLSSLKESAQNEISDNGGKMSVVNSKRLIRLSILRLLYSFDHSPLFFATIVRTFLRCFPNFSHFAAFRFFSNSPIAAVSSLMDRHCFLLTNVFRSLHNISIGLKSAELAGVLN